MAISKELTLCTNHSFIEHSLVQIKRQLKKDGHENKIVFDLIDESLKDVRIAKKQGMSLENRCKKYYNSIIKLGFERAR